MFFKKIGIDFGTSKTIVCSLEDKIFINEPTVVAVSVNSNKVLAIGENAKEMLGKTPAGVLAQKPLKNGVIANYKTTEVLLRYFIKKSRATIIKPDLYISTPLLITSVEKRAIMEAASEAGARKVVLIPQTYLAAVGAKIPVSSATASMIVNIGSGITEAAVISLNGIICFKSEKTGSEDFNEALMLFIRRKFALSISDQTAEHIKITIGCAVAKPAAPVFTEVSGREATSGLPRTMQINSNDLVEAFRNPLGKIVSVIKSLIESAPAELIPDIIDRGVVLSGGGSKFKDIELFLTKSLGVAFHIADDPEECSAYGLIECLGNYSLIESVISKPL